MRLGFDLCAEEKAFLSRRKQVVAKALKQVLQLDGDLQEDEVCGAGGYRCRYIAVALFQTLGSGHVGEDIGCGEASLGICSSQRAVTLPLGRSWVLALTLTPTGPDQEVPSLEAGGSSTPVRVKPTCVSVQSRYPLWASWPQEGVPEP